MSVDPFEITAQDPAAPPLPSLVSSLPSSSQLSTATGVLLQLGAMSLIGYAWLVADKIPVAWHAIVAIITVTLPTNSLTDLARGVVRGWYRRK